MPTVTYYVDESGDGILFGRKGKLLIDSGATSKFFILGMVQCINEGQVADKLHGLRKDILSNPLYSSIPSCKIESKKTAKYFHAKDDAAEIRGKVFELLMQTDFKFFAVVKEMKAVLRYVRSRERTDPDYRYKPDELYDYTARMLFKQQLHKSDNYRIIFARRGKSDRTRSLQTEIQKARKRFLESHNRISESEFDVVPAYPWEEPCLQVADYCLWALQRCFERAEHRFLAALWPKVAIIRDVDDPEGAKYGTYYSKKGTLPDPEKIKRRWI